MTTVIVKVKPLYVVNVACLLTISKKVAPSSLLYYSFTITLISISLFQLMSSSVARRTSIIVFV